MRCAVARNAEPIRRSRLSQQIVVQICHLIRQGQFGPGDRLPPERELAEQLQVSRASLREALRALEISGIVESRHGGGTYVRDFSERSVVSPLGLIFEAADDIIGDLWEVRAIFEPAVAAMTAVRASPEDVARLDEIVAEQEQAFHNFGDDDHWMTLDRAFHSSLAVSSGNKVAVRVLDLINQWLQDGRRHFVATPERRCSALTCHTQIRDAVREHQPDAAREAMLRHLQEVEEFILGELIEPSPTGSPSE